MRTRNVLAAAAAAALLAACGKESCPTTAGNANTSVAPTCGGSAQQVQITLQMCEACSHTSPSCAVQMPDATTIFLDTRWEVCTDNSSCSTPGCSGATCQFSAPAGTYTVHALSQSGTSTFTLNVGGGTPTCTSWI